MPEEIRNVNYKYIIHNFITLYRAHSQAVLLAKTSGSIDEGT